MAARLTKATTTWCPNRFIFFTVSISPLCIIDILNPISSCFIKKTIKFEGFIFIFSNFSILDWLVDLIIKCIYASIDIFFCWEEIIQNNATLTKHFLHNRFWNWLAFRTCGIKYASVYISYQTHKQVKHINNVRLILNGIWIIDLKRNFVFYFILYMKKKKKI